VSKRVIQVVHAMRGRMKERGLVLVEVIVIHLPHLVGIDLADANATIHHQLGKFLPIDEHDSFLDARHVLSGIPTELRGRDEDSLSRLSIGGSEPLLASASSPSAWVL
jgi:hypothetical protein